MPGRQNAKKSGGKEEEDVSMSGTNNGSSSASAAAAASDGATPGRTAQEKKAAKKSSEMALNESDEKLNKLFHIANCAHRLVLSTQQQRLVPDKQEIYEQFMNYVKEENMAPYYEKICQEAGINVDQSLVQKMKKANEEKLKEERESLEDAKENYGDTEILDALMRIANVYILIGDKENALKSLDDILEEVKHLSTGQKVDVAMKKALTGFFHFDTKLIREQTERAKELNDQGGDWDRRNRLKVFEGTYYLITRDLPKASELLLSSIAVFTAYEMYDYKSFVFYTVLVGMTCLDRVRLKKEVVDSPDVLSVILEVPHLSEFLNSLYECRYANFLEALVNIEPYLRRERYLADHASYLIREMRIRAYSQFLDAYKSVTMEGMAKAFGIGVKFLDSELSRFIAARRLNARIDKIRGVIETTRPDAKNAQYQEVIKHGDMLLNRVQGLSRSVHI